MTGEEEHEDTTVVGDRLELETWERTERSVREDSTGGGFRRQTGFSLLISSLPLL